MRLPAVSVSGVEVGRYLLDTHVVLWWLSSPERLSAGAREAIASGRNEVLMSAAAAWEMAIKRTLGRIAYPSNLEEVLRSDRISMLPVSVRHALAVADLPLEHQDPFDRMMIAQARVEGLTLITRDAKVRLYDVPTLEA